MDDGFLSRWFLAASVAAFSMAAAAAQSDQGPPRWAANIARKQQVILRGLPAAYASLHDPSTATEAKLRRGRFLFDAHCTPCHGWTGHGAGPEAFALVPQPADLEWLADTRKDKAEPYIYWSIAEGGRQFESDMPAFKSRMTEKDIWALVAYVRAGLPRSTP